MRVRRSSHVQNKQKKTPKKKVTMNEWNKSVEFFLRARVETPDFFVGLSETSIKTMLVGEHQQACWLPTMFSRLFTYKRGQKDKTSFLCVCMVSGEFCPVLCFWLMFLFVCLFWGGFFFLVVVVVFLSFSLSFFLFFFFCAFELATRDHAFSD